MKKRRRWDVQTRNAPGTEEPAKKKSGESSKPVLSAEAMVAEAKKRAAAMLHAKSVKPKTFDPVAAAKARAAAINKTFIQRQQEKCQTQSPGVPKNQVNQQQMMPLGSSVAVSGAQTQTQQSPPAIPQTPGTAVVTTPLNQTNSASNDSHKCLRKVYVGIPLRPPVEGMPVFMIIPELVGPNRQYTDHIGSTTQTSVQLRGFGSGCTGENSSQEPLHFAIGGSTEQQVTQAESLAQNLIATVRSKREQFYQRLRVPVPGPVYAPYGHVGMPPAPVAMAPAPVVRPPAPPMHFIRPPYRPSPAPAFRQATPQPGIRMSLGHSCIASVQLDASELGEDYEDESSSASKRRPRRSFTETSNGAHSSQQRSGMPPPPNVKLKPIPNMGPPPPRTKPDSFAMPPPPARHSR